MLGLEVDLRGLAKISGIISDRKTISNEQMTDPIKFIS